MSYAYNGDSEDADNGEVNIVAGLEKTSIPIAPSKLNPSSFMCITAQTVDEVGNISDGISISPFFTKSIIATKGDVEEKISNMTGNGKIIVIGEYSYDLLNNIKNGLINQNEFFIDLDLTNVTSMRSYDSAFSDCSSLRCISYRIL